MAIIENKEVTGSGFKKIIDEDSVEMILDMTQVSQYQKPHHSAIRETVSNAVDSVIERDLAYDILTGNEKLEDHYDTSVKTEGKYSGSQFDRNYYDIKYFSTEPKVLIEYFQRNSDDRDLVRITDTGVGLGQKRLEKSFNPGYSSKRLSKDTLGSFGIGAKSPLATGAESYVLTSYHNGRKYKFRIYVGKVDCLIPKFSNGKMNKYHLFEAQPGQTEEERYKAYYEDTIEKNGVIIEWEVKKHNIDIVEDAVRSQLMYFDTIIYRKHTGFSTETIDIKSDILYTDEEILVPKTLNKYVSKPHILLGREGKYVNYGPIDFDELELPEYEGGIGFKMSASDVAINPSRETLVWNEKTKAAILAKFEVVKDLINEQLKDQLQETDFVKWNIVAEKIHKNLNRQKYTSGFGYNNYYGSHNYEEQEDLVSVLAKLVNTSDGLSLKYSDDYSYTSLNNAFEIKDDNIRTAIRKVYISDTSKLSFNRFSVGNWSELDDKQVYITESEKADRIKDIHICKTLIGDNIDFILIHKNKIEKDDNYDLLLTSENLLDYDEIEVSDEDRASYLNKISIAEMTPAEARRINKKVVAKEYRFRYNHAQTRKVEYKIGEMEEDFDDNSIIYGHRDDATMLAFMSRFTVDTDKKVLLIAQNNLKHYKAFGKHVNDAFFTIDEDNKTVKVSDLVLNALEKSYYGNISTSDYFFLKDLKDILPEEYKIYEYIDGLKDDSWRHIRYGVSLQLFKTIETYFNINIKSDDCWGDSSGHESLINLDNYLLNGYTFEPVHIKEQIVLDNFKDKLKDFYQFLNHISYPDKYSTEINKYLTANGYQKLDSNHGWY